MALTITRISVNQKIIAALTGLGMTGIYSFTFDDKIWYQISPQNHIHIQAVFLYLFSVFMFLGTCIVREKNVKTIGQINALIVCLIVGLIWGSVGLRDNTVVFGILGVTVGLLYATVFYWAIYGLPTETRLKLTGLLLFIGYVFHYLSNYALQLAGLSIVLPIICLIFLVFILLVHRVNKEEVTSPNSLESHSFPTNLILLLGLIIFISYFEAFLVGNGITFLDIRTGKTLEWVSQVIHLLIFLGFFISNRKPNYTSILYVSLISTIFAYTFSILPFNSKVLVCVFFNISDALGDIFLCGLLPQIAFKHGKKPMVFSILILCVALGVIASSYFGGVAYFYLKNRSVFIYGIFLILFCSYLLLLPYLSKHINDDLDEYKNSSRTLKSGAAMFNHSLKNMIVQIKCGIEILKKSPHQRKEEIQDTLDIISDSVSQMMDIVKHINQNTEEIEIIKEPCNMEEIVNSVIESARLFVGDQNIKIKKTFDSDTYFRCDQKRIKEILYNLIKNSCEAIKGDNGEIAIIVTKTRRKLICRVCDNGKGIPADQLENLFKPFYTTKKLESYNYGLGLTHCYMVVERHNGKIKVESEENKGTCISLIFPV